MSGIRKSITMLENTGHLYNVIGPPIRADSYFGYNDGLHTVQVTYQNFTGGFGIQGTLALGRKCSDSNGSHVEIDEEDWFNIKLADLSGNCSEYPFIVYPKDPLNPTGNTRSNPFVNPQGDTGTEAFTFVGNFTYLRAYVNRDYIQPQPQPQSDGRFLLGQIDKVLLSL